MAFVTVDPPQPLAPTPKVIALRKIIRAFAELPVRCDLGQINEFSTLLNIIDDSVVNYHVLRTLYIDFLIGKKHEMQVCFTINWQTMEVVTAGSKTDATGRVDKIMLPKVATTAEGEEFLQLVSQKLAELYVYVRQTVEECGYERANWTIELRTDDRNPEVVAAASLIEEKYNLTAESADYLAERANLENSQPITARYRKRTLKEMFMRIIQRK